MIPNKINLYYKGSPKPIEVSTDKLLCNDITLPGDFNPHNIGLWVVETTLGNFGLVLGAVWANCEQDALDELIDNNMGNSLIVEEKDIDLELEKDGFYAHLGNAGEVCDLSDVGLREVVFEPKRDWKILCMFAEARGAGSKFLSD